MVQRRNLTEGEALDYLANGQAFELLSEEPQKFSPKAWTEYASVRNLKTL